MREPASTLAETGAEHAGHVLAPPDLADLLAAADRLISGRPGGRIFGDEMVRRLCDADGDVGRLARGAPAGRPAGQGRAVR